jgi:hypothetical protein
MSAATTRILSAIGSRSLPRSDVLPVRRAQRPSNQSVVIAAMKTPVAQ